MKKKKKKRKKKKRRTRGRGGREEVARRSQGREGDNKKLHFFLAFEAQAFSFFHLNLNRSCFWLFRCCETTLLYSSKMLLSRGTRAAAGKTVAAAAACPTLGAQSSGGRRAPPRVLSSPLAAMMASSRLLVSFAQNARLVDVRVEGRSGSLIRRTIAPESKETRGGSDGEPSSRALLPCSLPLACWLARKPP